MKKNNKLCRLLLKVALFILALFVVAFICLWQYDQQFLRGHKAAYMPDYGYARALGLWRLDDDEIERKYGEPNETEYRTDPKQKSRTLIVCSYPDFQAVNVEDTLVSGKIVHHLILLEVTSESPHFGRNRIGLGSTREEVQDAYSRDEKIEPNELLENARDYPNVSEGYYGQNWSRILFCYNEQGVVVSMAYEPSEF
jgi:hypothetical protein